MKSLLVFVSIILALACGGLAGAFVYPKFVPPKVVTVEKEIIKEKIVEIHGACIPQNMLFCQEKLDPSTGINTRTTTDPNIIKFSAISNGGQTSSVEDYFFSLNSGKALKIEYGTENTKFYFSNFTDVTGTIKLRVDTLPSGNITYKGIFINENLRFQAEANTIPAPDEDGITFVNLGKGQKILGTNTELDTIYFTDGFNNFSYNLKTDKLEKLTKLPSTIVK